MPIPAAAQHGPVEWDGSGLHWTSQPVAPGVSVRTGELEQSAVTPYWTVTVDASATNALTGQPTTAELGTAQWARDTANRLTAAGYPARQDVVDWPEFSDTPRGVEGLRVRTGAYASRPQATAAVSELRSHGFPTAAAEWTGFDADEPADHERVHVAVIDPTRWRGDITATHDGTVAQREKTSTVAGRLGALVAVNGGFFATSDNDGYPGVPSGLAAYQGRLESQSAGSRAALVLGPGRPRIENVRSTVTVRAGDASHAVEGINRKPGLVRDCGRAGARPTTQPRQDFTCTSDAELVMFTPEFGAELPHGPGLQVVLDRTGRVTSVGARGGGRVRADESVIQAIGASADWVRAHVTVGDHLPVEEEIRDRSGVPVPLWRGIVSAAPMLLRGGRLAVDAATEGVVDPRDLSFGYAWSEQRAPRTMAGIDARGRLLLVTVDGRQPGVSDGVTLTEGARLMRTLGAVDAMNLDGGGSTTMAVNGVLVNHPSDATGERAVGDTVVVLPRSSGKGP